MSLTITFTPEQEALLRAQVAKATPAPGAPVKPDESTPRLRLPWRMHLLQVRRRGSPSAMPGQAPGVVITGSAQQRYVQSYNGGGIHGPYTVIDSNGDGSTYETQTDLFNLWEEVDS